MTSSSEALIRDEAEHGRLRVRYREFQTIRWVDLDDEQAYLVAGRGRHLSVAHRPGVARGLRLIAWNRGVVLLPGVAVDDLGRLLVVTGSIVLAAENLQVDGSEALDLWLQFSESPFEPARAGRWPMRRASPSRSRETARIRLTPARADDPQPMAAVAASRALAPAVYLGRVTIDGATVGAIQPLAVGLTGARVASPAGPIRVDIGGQDAGEPWRFAIAMKGTGGSWRPHLALAGDGSASAWGSVTVHDDLVIEAFTTAAPSVGACEREPDLDELARRIPAPGVAFAAAAVESKTAQPWSVGRVQPPTPEVGKVPPAELRIENGTPGPKEDPARYRIVIGQADDDVGFAGTLRVDADCTVRILGDLEVEGQISEGPVPADPDDPRFAQAVADSVDTGLRQEPAGIAALTVALEVPSGLAPGGAASSYSVHLTNTGSMALTNLSVAQIRPTAATVDGAGLPAILAPGGSATVQVSLAVPTTETDLLVQIQAQGLGPLGRRAVANDWKSIPVRNPVIN